jgi:hypothetical protein
MQFLSFSRIDRSFDRKGNVMAQRFKIHPAIGIARLGNSPDKFYLAPEEAGALPIECDPEGNPVPGEDGQEVRVRKFKDDQGRVMRQAARFRIYVYDEQSPEGREVKIGDEIEVAAVQGKSFALQQNAFSGAVQPGSPSGQILRGTLVDISWTVYLANKKAVWYQFKELEGEHGYSEKHPLRNADITEKHLRQKLIIDPGPQTVSSVSSGSAEFAQGKNPGSAQTFPPPLEPASITTLGEIKANVQAGHGRLIVLGGYGNSGSALTGLGQPVIEHYANNDGWFDDISDGPITATLKIQVTSVDGRPRDPDQKSFQYAVNEGAWVIVGYPRFAPQLVDIVTMDDVVYDLAVREFAEDINMYGLSPFDATQKPPSEEDLPVWREQAVWNTNYYPFFWRDIWPILQRPYNYQWVMDFDSFTGGDPHNTTPGADGNMDPDWLSVAPYAGEPAQDREQRRQRRQFIYNILRQPGMENRLTIAPFPGQPKNLPMAMPFLCGDNPLSNTVASKFLRLTDTQLFLLRQWAQGKFINERTEPLAAPAEDTAARSGRSIDRGVLSNLLGGAFCPGGEAAWIMRNPAIYSSAYRINQSTAYKPGSLSQKGNFAKGLEPGDITKYSAQPWQSDFNECSTNNNNITYEDWNKIQPKSTGDPMKQKFQLTYWWPAHRPMEVFYKGGQVYWAQGIPQSKVGDLMMVTAWSELGFIINNPQYTPANGAAEYILIEGANVPGDEQT